MRALLVLASLLLPSGIGHAQRPSATTSCNCIRAAFQLESPSGDTPAATTDHVVVSFDDSGWHIPVRIVLRDAHGELVPATQRSLRRGRLRLLEATPRSPLDHDSHYEVIVVELGPRQIATVVGAFQTTRAVPAARVTSDWRPAFRSISRKISAIFTL